MAIRHSYNYPNHADYNIDYDDGSSVYNTTFNFNIYGGIKFRDGIEKHAFGNLIAYVDYQFPICP